MVELNRFKWALIKSLRKIRFKSLRKIRFKSLRKIRFESLRKIRFESLRKIRFNLLRKIHFNLRRKNRFNSLQNQFFTFVGIRIILLFFALFGQYKFKRFVHFTIREIAKFIPRAPSLGRYQEIKKTLFGACNVSNDFQIFVITEEVLMKNSLRNSSIETFFRMKIFLQF